MHVLRIQATDAGGMTSQATVKVYLSDVNDQHPTFVATPYSFRVREGLSKATVGSVKAVDSDTAKNAVVKYSILPPETSEGKGQSDSVDLFTVDADTGEIRTVTELDFETQVYAYFCISKCAVFNECSTKIFSKLTIYQEIQVIFPKKNHQGLASSTWYMVK